MAEAVGGIGITVRVLGGIIDDPVATATGVRWRGGKPKSC